MTTRLEQSITEHARFLLRNRRYARALQFKNDADVFAREIHEAGYATGPQYADVLIKFMRDCNLYRFGQPLLYETIGLRAAVCSEGERNKQWRSANHAYFEIETSK
jgi:flagellum-specific peptidoglycan hydrolase FlgJ